MPSVFSIILSMLIGSFVLSIGLAIYSFRLRVNFPAKLFSILMMIVSAWIFQKILILFIDSAQIRENLHLINIFLVVIIAPFLFLITIFHTRQLKWFKPKHSWLVFIEPALICLLIVVPALRPLLFYDFKVNTEYSLPLHSFRMNVGYYVLVAYSIFLFIVSFVLLIRSVINKTGYFRWQMFLFFMGVFIPFAADTIYILGFSPIKNFNFAPVIFSLSNYLIAWSLYGYRFFKLLPVTRNLVIDKMTEIMIVTNSENFIVDINKSCETIFNLDKDKTIGKPFYDVFIIYPELVENYDLRNNLVKELTLKKNGIFYHYSINISLVEDENKNLVASIILLNDITERKSGELLIQKQNKELKELNSTKDKFFSIIGHDLKNPFNTILGFSQMLNEEKNFDKSAEYAEIIYNSANRAYVLLDNLLNWSRSQTGDIKFNPENIDLNRLISEISELFSIQYELKNIRLINEINNKPIVYADKNMLNSILQNLIANAIKFTHRNGQINISATKNGNLLEISVSDNGVGMSEKAMNKLFKIAEGKSTLGTEQEKGTGLGLFLCKEFVEKHGCSIWVKSELNKGSIFTFSVHKADLPKGKPSITQESPSTEEIPESEKAFKYSAEFMCNILPLKIKLSQLNYYDTSEILNLLKNYQPVNEEFTHWKNEVENAVFFSDKNKYSALTNPLNT